MQPQFITLHKKAKDVSGERFGRLVALGPITRRKKDVMWLCQCDCGNTPAISVHALRSGNTQSCGCLHKELLAARATVHGMRHNRWHETWTGMIQRCTNPNNKVYHHYGGRGIAVFEEWKQSFESFHDYITQLPNCGEKGYSLDRIDNNKNYEPGNLQWASQTMQTRNSRRNHMLTLGNKTQCLSAWAEEIGIPSPTIRRRLKMGWSDERALSIPVRK